MAADSLGVAIPMKIEPNTTSTSTTSGRKYKSAFRRSLQDTFSNSTAGARSGRTVQMMTM